MDVRSLKYSTVVTLNKVKKGRIFVPLKEVTDIPIVLDWY